MVDMNKVFENFDEADPSSTGARHPGIKVHGEHVVEIEAIRLKESEQYNAVYYIVEFRVLETNDPEHVHVGKTYAWAHDVTNKWFGMSNTKQFLAAAMGFDPTSEEAAALGRAEVEESFGADQPLTGQTLRVNTSPKTTKGGYIVVVHDWQLHED